MFEVVKPQIEDLQKIEEILIQWTDKEETEKYIRRIKNEIEGTTEFNIHFWVAKENREVLGVIGISDPLPKTVQFSKTDKPAEVKILYVDKNSQAKGVGKTLIQFLESEARKSNYSELLVRSALRYKNTAWGFYKKMGYEEVGELIDKEKEMMQVFRKEI